MLRRKFYFVWRSRYSSGGCSNRRSIIIFHPYPLGVFSILFEGGKTKFEGLLVPHGFKIATIFLREKGKHYQYKIFLKC